MATTSGAASAAASKVNEAGARIEGNKVEADIEALKADLAMLREHLQKTGRDSYRAARRVANDGVETLKVQGEEAMATARASAREFEDQLSETVREKPITSLAIAAGIGFLFALFTRR
jgi:ElaB/YqjD/DUF883 family membrane-anchored ribosome-binding protein